MGGELLSREGWGEGGTNPLRGTEACRTAIGEVGGVPWSLRGGGRGQERSGRGIRLRPMGPVSRGASPRGPVWCPPWGCTGDTPLPRSTEGTEAHSPSPACCPLPWQHTGFSVLPARRALRWPRARGRPQRARAGDSDLVTLLSTAGRQSRSSFPSMKKFVDIREIWELANGVTVLPKMVTDGHGPSRAGQQHARPPSIPSSSVLLSLLQPRVPTPSCPESPRPPTRPLGAPPAVPLDPGNIAQDCRSAQPMAYWDALEYPRPLMG